VVTNLNTRSIIGFTTASSIIPPHYGVTADDGTPAGHVRRHETNTKTMQERAETDKEEMLARMESKMDASTKSNQEQMLKNIDTRMNTTIEEMNASHKEMLAKMEVERKADLENLKSVMERMTNANQAKTDVKFKELTETIEKNADGITDSRSVPRRADKETLGRLNKNLCSN
jgi:hypothetical protein